MYIRSTYRESHEKLVIVRTGFARVSGYEWTFSKLPEVIQVRWKLPKQKDFYILITGSFNQNRSSLRSNISDSFGHKWWRHLMTRWRWWRQSYWVILVPGSFLYISVARSKWRDFSPGAAARHSQSARVPWIRARNNHFCQIFRLSPFLFYSR